MLMESNLTADQSKRLTASIYKASQRIQELLQDLVNVSRGKGERPEVCQLSEVIGSAGETVGNVADSHGVNLSLVVPDNIELPLERTRMERVFINMINNALDAMPQGGDLRITAKVEGDDVLIEVDDTGNGISPKVRSTLFQPFASDGKRNGLGLGLALSRQTVLDHGGDLWAEEKRTRGARFQMRLPLKGHDGRGRWDGPQNVAVPRSGD